MAKAGRTSGSIAGGMLLGALAIALTPSLAAAAQISPTTLADDNSNNGNCTLREAVRAANADAAVDACPAGSGADRIELAPGTYALAIPGRGEDEALTGDLDIEGGVTIVGDQDGSVVDGNASDREWDSNGIDRLFDVHSGDVTFETLTIRGGNAGAGDGGGIRVLAGTTRVHRSTIAYNTAANGGGIEAAGSRMSVGTSTIIFNGIGGQGSDATSGDGYGVRAMAGQVGLTMSTVSGVTKAGAPVSIKGTIVDYCEGTLTSRGYNVINPGDGVPCMLAPRQPTDLPDTFVGLGDLGDRGGPTPTTVFDLLSPFPLDKGPPASDPDCGGTTDQRGVPRPQYARCDIGAYEYANARIGTRGVVRNTRRGTARVKLSVSRPGTVTLEQTKRLKGASETVLDDGGRLSLPLRPRGEARRRLSRSALRRRDKERVSARTLAHITYEAEFYVRRSIDRRVKLVRRR